jgi:KDO2-lipid IV(A) lauroyltransferase
MTDNRSLAAAAPRLRDFLAPRYWLTWIVLGGFRVFAWLPARVVWLCGYALGEAAFHLNRTPTVRTNLRLCFPELSGNERERLRRRYYRRFGQVFLDFGLAWRGSAGQLRRRARIRGREHVEKARAEGRPVIFLAPHSIGLEVGWARLNLEWPMICMYRRPKDALFQQALLHFRSRFGGLAIERYAGLKPLVRHLLAGRLFYYLPDQDPDRPDKNFVFAPFFNVPTATFTALGRLAKLVDAVVITCFTHQLPHGRGYEIVLHPPLENFPTGDEQADTTRMNAEIERVVREAPEQYFWSYRRFKTRPDNEPSPYRR